MKRTRKRIILCLSIISVVGGLVSYLFFGKSSLRFIETPRRVAIRVAVSEHYNEFVDQNGQPIWPKCRELLDGDELEPNEFTELWLVVEGFYSQEGHVYWRDVLRDGENIRVVYMSIIEAPISLIHRFFFSANLTTQNDNVRTAAFQGIEHSPQMVEIYYLHNIHRIQKRIDRLSDEDFYDLRMGTVSVWSGLVGVVGEAR